MSLQEAFYARLADEGISIWSMTTEEMRRVNEIIAELLSKHRGTNT